MAKNKDNKTAFVSFRLTKEEYEVLMGLVERTEYSISEIMRKLILGEAI